MNVNNIHFLNRFLIAPMMICGILSCQSTKEEDQEVKEYFQSISLDLKAPSRRLSELVDKVEVVRLEETERSLLGVAWDVKLEEGHFLIPSEDRQSLYVFNEVGRFINQFNRFGEGPEEYSSITSYWLKSDTLFLFDHLKQTLFGYGLDGDLLRSRKTDYMANHAFEFDNRYWLDLSFREQSDSLAGQIVSLNSELVEPIYFLEPLGDIGFPTGAPVNSFASYGNSLLFHQLLSDSVYQIKDGRVEPYLHFDLGGEFLWSLPEIKSEASSPVSLIMSTEKVWLLIPRVAEEWIHIDYNIGFGDGNEPEILHHRPSGKSVLIDVQRSNQQPYEMAFNEWYADRMLISMSSSDLGEFLKELDETQISFAEGSSLEGIRASENPVLMWVQFKSDF